MTSAMTAMTRFRIRRFMTLRTHGEVIARTRALVNSEDSILISKPNHTDGYACGVLGRKTPQPRHLTALATEG